MESIKKGRRLRPSLSPLKKKCEYQNYAFPCEAEVAHSRKFCSLVFILTHFINSFRCFSTQYNVLASLCMLYSYSLNLIAQTLDVTPSHKHVARDLSNQLVIVYAGLFQWLEVSFSVADCRSKQMFRRKRSMFHRTAIFEKPIMLTVISHGDLCKFKSSVDTLAGTKYFVIKYECQLYQFMCN
jgi:hypothetical protein